ncbi:phosphate ABC transporter substrate-binding protein [Catenovulum sediminis]|uniref:Phosphate ABC transporter substrate-binding protein n=1 Tax=Catenovulum sediminis TaxID=1740262 RepID=A0ABV1RII1_9ALTE
MKQLIAILILLSCFCSRLYADIVVIVHPKNTAILDVFDIRQLFLGKAKSYPNGIKAIPVNLTSGHAREIFNKQVLQKSNSQLKAYWAKLVFTGRGVPPAELDNDQAVINMVLRNQDAIGYIDQRSLTSEVRVIAEFEGDLNGR